MINYSFAIFILCKEWAYTNGKVEKDKYVEQTNTILDQYKNSVNAFSNTFREQELDQFIKEYGLENYKLGINRIKQGKVQLSSDKTVSLINKL